MNKLRPPLSLFLISWLLAFMVLSTSHMGRSHHFYFSDTSNIPTETYSEPHSDSQNSDCPWGTAQLSTTGDFIFSGTFVAEQSSQFIAYHHFHFLPSITVLLQDPRAPPVS